MMNTIPGLAAFLRTVFSIFDFNLLFDLVCVIHDIICYVNVFDRLHPGLDIQRCIPRPSSRLIVIHVAL